MHGPFGHTSNRDFVERNVDQQVFALAQLKQEYNGDPQVRRHKLADELNSTYPHRNDAIAVSVPVALLNRIIAELET